MSTDSEHDVDSEDDEEEDEQVMFQIPMSQNYGPRAFEPGRSVFATGVKSRPGLNGREGKVVRWVLDSARYEIQFENEGRLIALQPKNITLNQADACAQAGAMEVDEAPPREIVSGHIPACFPHEMFALVFARLPFAYAGRVAMVSQIWSELAKDDSWKPEMVAYSWGDGDVHGHGLEVDYVGAPRLLRAFQRVPIRSVVCSHETTFLVTHQGQVMWWGASWCPEVFPDVATATPFEVHAGQRTRQLAVTVPGYHHRQSKGQYHLAALMETGELYTWGFDMMGQCLGVGAPNQDLRAAKYIRAHPALVSSLPADERVEGVSCGVTCTCVLTRTPAGESRVYTAGVYNFTTHHPTYELTTVGRGEDGGDFFAGKRITEVLCGGFFGIALTAEGELYTWGCTLGPDQANGTLLGRPTPGVRFTMSPGKVELSESVRSLACSTYSLLAVTESGKALTWGDQDGNALGRAIPAVLVEGGPHAGAPFQVDGAEGVAIVKGALSYTNGGVVSENGDVRVWGGAAWKGGVGSGSEEARLVDWGGLPACYLCEDLELAHRHGLVVFRKKGATVLI